TITVCPQSILEIERCDLNIKNNNSSHHTDLNGEERLIVRRGEPFNIILHLKPGSKEFKLDESSFTFIVETGPLPRKESDTQVSFNLCNSTVDTEWSASAINNPSENTLCVYINSSPNSPIGVYSLSLDQEGQKTHLGQFTLLFNAWCPRDAVYMHNERKRKEYVLSQHGQIYKGTYKRIKGTPWNFGQFESGILDICLKILDENPKFVSDADKDCSARRNPIYVTRVLSAMINSNDDRGVLVGEWYDFSGGVHPGAWIGSGDILHKWAESGPVRYGQCWVFAALACTVSRALGIPCRVVTNFRSAHDTDANLVIENLYNDNAEKISSDSIWNFHVWVDSWMTRPDLGPEYDGWQTSDPTPQEPSDGVFCCGPASLRAIKEGELTKKYDTPFIFAEVNADVVDMLHLSNGEVIRFSGSTKSVGCFISTKAVGSDERHDITHQYKYPEGGAVLCGIGTHITYCTLITSDRLIQLSAFAFDKQTIDYSKTEKTIVLDEPDIDIKLMGDATVNQPVTANLTLLNPLPEQLQDCSFTIEGVGLTDGKPITVNPSSSGSTVLLVNFDSNKLSNIKSFVNVVVKEGETN
uniref:Protein-glutamine gamma-glutamyltransferase 2 n=1 Tax=Anabas testudineus TaxID=64144 RepID=A0A7N6BJ92_ANATE